MKGFVSSAAIAAVLLSSPGVESFAPASRRVAVIAPEVQLHRPTLMYASNNNYDNFVEEEEGENDDAGKRPSSSSSSSSRRYRYSRFLSNLRRKSKPAALALLTATTLRGLGSYGHPSSSFLRPLPARASTPIVLRPSMEKDDPPMIKALKDAEKLRKKKSMDEFDAFMARCNDIEESQGKAARNAYEKQYQIDKDAAEVQKKKDIEILKRELLDKGQDPHTEVDAERQLFLLEHDMDLAKCTGTPQNELMIKSFRKKGGKKGAIGPDDPDYHKNQRYIIACQVADLKARGVDPLAHFAEKDVKDKTRAIYKMEDRVAVKVAERYRGLMEEYGGRLTPAKPGEVPFVVGSDDDAVAAAAVVAGASTKGDKAATREAAKAEAAAAKEARLAEKAAAREERVAAKEARLAEKATAKEARLAEKAAAREAKKSAAATSSAAEVAAAPSAMADDDVVATANGDVFAAAGNDAGHNNDAEASSSTAAVATQQTASEGGSDIVTTIKSYATPKNVGAVVVGAGVVNFGIKYYQENNSGAQAERERQLKLILGNEEDDDEDDEFDDEDDDDYEQFTKKTPEPPKSEPPETVDEPKVAKPAPPPPPATPPKPAPKPKRKLGIFAKRNADARETDLNVLVGPEAQAPEFASLLAKILTFGAPGRFPVVSSWGSMPFDEFDLEKAKELLTESRGDAGLADEQSAEIFASVVNCMIIDIVDLASSTLKGKDKDKNEKLAVDAINVVMDFMDHAASLFDAVAKDVTIKPVTYGGTLRKKDLEQMFSVYASSSMMGMGLDGAGSTQDRVDTLQLVFAIPDKKAEGLMQKHMMKMMMNLMKDGGKGLDGMPGMEGMDEMMKAMGGMEGMPGMPDMDGEISPEDLKGTVAMMKELMDSGQVSDEELAEVRGQFKEMYGSDIADLIKKADEEGAGEGMTDDERALLDMFKQILGE